MTTVHDDNKRALTGLRAALYDVELDAARAALDQVMAPDARVRMAHPFEDLDGPSGLLGDALSPLVTAWPDLEETLPGGHGALAHRRP